MTSSNDIIVVTGASTGIGKACALHLDRLGFAVYAGVRKEADGAALASEASSRLVPVILDVTDAATIASAASAVETAASGHGVRGLVNNAGIAVGGPLEFVPIDELRRQLEVNVVGQVAVTQAFLPALRQAKGRIVNIGSISGRMATPFVGPYAASKFALEAITDALRIELRPWGIGVSIVEPGSIDTPIWDKGQEQQARIREQLPPAGQELYAHAMDAMTGALETFQRRAVPPQKVADAVAHALTAKRPKTRYLIGTDARLQAVMSTVAPDRLADRLITRQLKLP